MGFVLTLVACIAHPTSLAIWDLGTGKRGHYERGLFTGVISRIPKISRFSRISRKWPDSPLFSRVWGFSKISRISKFSRISRKWTFLKRPLFQKTPFSEPEDRGRSHRRPNRNECPNCRHFASPDMKMQANIAGFSHGLSWHFPVISDQAKGFSHRL